MSRPVLAMTCALVSVVSFGSPAHADTYGEIISLAWPERPDDGSMAADVPTNTQLWLRSSTSSGPTGFTLRGADGVAVVLDTEVVSIRQGAGYDTYVTILTPAKALAPDSVYTITADDDLEVGEQQLESPLGEVSFRTGAGPASSPTHEVTGVEYVAHEGLELSYGGCCVDDDGDTLHAVRWRMSPGEGTSLARLTIRYPGEDPLTIVRIKDEFGTMTGGDQVALTHSFEQTEYPCVDFSLIDVTGGELASLNTCEPSMCVTPPTVDQRSIERGAFLPDPARWDAEETSCALDDATGGCATAPTSPIPHTPLALGGLALLGLLRNTRTRRRNV